MKPDVRFRLPCEVEWRYTEKGERVRISLRSGRVVPVPIVSRETYDYKTPNSYEGTRLKRHSVFIFNV